MPQLSLGTAMPRLGAEGRAGKSPLAVGTAPANPAKDGGRACEVWLGALGGRSQVSKGQTPRAWQTVAST